MSSIAELIGTLQQLEANAVDAQLRARGLSMQLEPMTAFTDAILAMWTAFLAALLFAKSRGARPVRFWAWGFVAASLSSLAGVAYHGFRTWFPSPVVMTEWCWKLVPLTTGIAAFCLGTAAALAWLQPRWRTIAIALLGAEFVACVVAAALSNSFLVAALDYVPVLLALLVGAVIKRPVAGFIAAGVLTSFLAFGIQLRESWTYHNDVFHLVQMIAMYLLYRGAPAS